MPFIGVTRFLHWQDAYGGEPDEGELGQFAAVAPLMLLLDLSANLVDGINILAAAVVVGGAEPVAVAADVHLCHIAQCLVAATLVVVLGVDAAMFPRSLFRSCSHCFISFVCYK